MTGKKKLQIFISIAAILVGIIHLLFPSFTIDGVFVTLLIVSIIPWLEPLFKSVELPGGLKVEFQDLKNIEDNAIKAGLIKSDTTDNNLTSTDVDKLNSQTYLFVEIAKSNQELALVIFRIEVERRLRSIGAKYNIRLTNSSITKLIVELANRSILSSPEANTLKDIIQTLNRASHGIEYDVRNADWVIDNGSKILESLDEKLEIQGGRITVGSINEKEHWIDKSFNACKWTTNQEWSECIEKHSALWQKQLDNTYEALLSRLNNVQKEHLRTSQENWSSSLQSTVVFLQSFENWQLRIGREGMLIFQTNQMNKIKDRALELDEILSVMIEEDH